MRTIFAAVLSFVAASVVPALAFAVMNPFVQGFKSILLWMIVFLAYAAFPALIVAVPAFLVLLRFKLVRWWSMSGVGAIAGALVSTTLFEPSGPGPNDVVAFAAVGAAAGMIFWLTWKMCGGDVGPKPSSVVRKN